MSQIKQQCPHCHKEYTLGVDGIISGCDDCENIVRASNGYAIDEPLCCCYEIAGDNQYCPVPAHIRAWSAS